MRPALKRWKGSKPPPFSNTDDTGNTLLGVDNPVESDAHIANPFPKGIPNWDDDQKVNRQRRPWEPRAIDRIQVKASGEERHLKLYRVLVVLRRCNTSRIRTDFPDATMVLILKES